MCVCAKGLHFSAFLLLVTNICCLSCWSLIPPLGNFGIQIEQHLNNQLQRSSQIPMQGLMLSYHVWCKNVVMTVDRTKQVSSNDTTLINPGQWGGHS